MAKGGRSKLSLAARKAEVESIEGRDEGGKPWPAAFGMFGAAWWKREKAGKAFKAERRKKDEKALARAQ